VSSVPSFKPNLDLHERGVEATNQELDNEFKIVDDTRDSQSESNARGVATLLKLLPLGISCLTLLYLFHLGSVVDSIRNNDKQVLVQTQGGRSILAQRVDNYVRTSATVDLTVKLWTDLTFNWVQKLPNGKGDPGVKIGTKIFPTRFIVGSTLLSKEIQQIWLDVFSQRDDYLGRNFLNSDATRIYYPKLQTSPKPPINERTGRPIENRLEVEIYGDWIEYSQDYPQGKLIEKLAFRLGLRPVVKTEPPISEDADSLQRAAYELRANGLEIYNIQRISHVR
jgi:hypothetical protein